METDHVFYLKDVVSATDNAILLNKHLSRLILHDRELCMRAQYTALGRMGIGTLIGFGLNTFLAIRLRRSRIRLINAFALAQRPTSVGFANNQEALAFHVGATITSSKVEALSTYILFGLGGAASGLVVGNIWGQRAAKQLLREDPESSLRIAGAFLKYRVELLEQAGKNIKGAKSKTHAVHRQISEQSDVEEAADSAAKEDEQDTGDKPS